MVKTIGRDDREELLASNPPGVVKIIATRALLRVLPLISSGLEFSIGPKREESLLFTSAVLRALSLARFASKYPERSISIQSDTKIEIKMFSYGNFWQIESWDQIAAKIGRAASAVALVKASSDFIEIVSEASELAYDEQFMFYRSESDSNLADTYLDRASVNRDIVWQEIIRDLDDFADITPARLKNSIQKLADASLWRTRKFGLFRSDWDRLKHSLTDDENWNVWFDWYEDRVAGRRSALDREFPFVEVPPEVWKEGPAAGNRWIAARLGPVDKVIDARILA